MGTRDDQPGPSDGPTYRPDEGTLGGDPPPTRPATPVSPWREGALLAGRYRLERALGSGGFGTVHLAKDETLDRRVAVKLLHGHVERERFAREARALARLQHPHVVAVHDFGTEDGRDYLVLEHVDGPSLSDLLQRGPLPWRDAVCLMGDIAAALAHAADHGVLHRDIKPSNVLLADGRHAKVVDFGIARIEGEAPLTSTGAVVGTLAYLAPETLDRGAYDERSEIWSLGALLHELLSGERAFDSSSNEQLVKSILSGDPRALHCDGDLPTALSELVARCLSKEPDERLQSAAALERELRALLPIASSDESTELVPARLLVSPAVAPPAGERRRVALLWIEERHLDELVERHGDGRAERLRRQMLEPVLRILETHGGLVADVEHDGVLAIFGLPRVRASDVSRAHAAAEAIVRIPDQIDAAQIAIQHACALGLGGIEGGKRQRPRPRPAERRELRGLLTDATGVVETADFEDARRGLEERGTGRRGDLGRPVADSPLIGRSAELGLLREAARAALSGRGLVATIQGEAGLGKSHLLATLLGELGTGDAAPLILTAEAPDEAAAAPGELARRLGEQIVEQEAVTSSLDELDARRLTQLLGSDTDLSPREREDASRAAWAKALRALARQGRTVIAVEDLHSADAASVRLLERVAEMASQLPILLVATHRPGLTPAWTGRPFHRPLVLAALNRSALVELLAAELPDASDERRERLLDLADGNPFYLLQLARSRGDGDTSELHLPESVGAVLAERLDQLPRVQRELLQAGAILGRDFPLAGAAMVAGLEVDDADSRREQLVSSGQLFDCHAWAEAGCSFPHPLLREAALASLSVRAVREMHGRAASLVESGKSEALGATPERLAYHWSRSQDEARALPFLDRAAERARSAGNLGDAVELARRAVEIAEVETGDATDEATRLRLAEVLAWAGEAKEARAISEELAESAARRGDTSRELSALRSLALGLGFAGHAREQLEVLDRARSLSTAAGTEEVLADILARRCEALYSLSLTERAEEQLRELGELEIDDIDVRLDRHKLGALIAFRRGDLGLAAEQAERGLALARSNDRRSRAVRFLSQRATILATLGPVSAARAAAMSCLEEARAAGLAATVSYALVALATAHLDEGEPAEAERLASEAAARAEDLGLDQRRMVALQQRASALLEQDRLDEASRALDEAMSIASNLESAAWLREICAQRAWLAMARGDVEQARGLVKELRQDASEAEDWRRLATALAFAADLAVGPEARREAEKSVEIAKRSGSPASKVRALTCLARACRRCDALGAASEAAVRGLALAESSGRSRDALALRFEHALCSRPPQAELARDCLTKFRQQRLFYLAREAEAELDELTC